MEPARLVFRDYSAPGGERAYVVERNGQSRFSSDVGANDADLFFGRNGANDRITGIVWYESIKMQVAAEVMGDLAKFYRGPVMPMPHCFTAVDLAALSIYTLIASAVDAIRDHLGSAANRMSLAVTMGIPTSFYDLPALRHSFASICRTAYEVYRQSPQSRTVLKRREARQLLDSASATLRSKGALAEEEIPDWIRTETMAALLWPLDSPAFSGGRYALVDIGAGTTNVSIFRIVVSRIGDRWVKDKIDCHSSISHAIGMDSVDRQLAKLRGLDADRWSSLRGREQDMLSDPRLLQGCEGTLADIHSCYSEAWTRALPTLKEQTEISQWSNHKILFIGGGGTVSKIRDRLRRSPIPEHASKMQSSVQLTQPPDLYRGRDRLVSAGEMAFLSIAHGLSYPEAAIVAPTQKDRTAARPIRFAEPRKRRWEDPELGKWSYLDWQT
jgi:hypothetical protein